MLRRGGRMLTTFFVLFAAGGCETSSGVPSSAAKSAAAEARACPPTAPSYRADVAPTLRQKCFACHAGSGDEVEDHDFSTFEKVHAQRTVIEGKVRARAMPPVGLPQLTDRERGQFLDWLACQAPNN